MAKGKKVESDSVSVEFSGGIREFTREIHGDDFAELAAEFAETNGGTVLADAPVEAPVEDAPESDADTEKE